MGIVLAGVIEDFYNDELWRTRDGLLQRLEAIASKRFSLEVANSFIDWRLAPSRDEMLRLCTEGALNYVGKTLKAHKLLGPYARSEVDLVGYLDKYNPIGGRADVIFRRDDTGVTILDGKNSKEHWDKRAGQPHFYTDPDQLRWYALCYLYAYRQMPDRLGFTYYRYPHGYDWAAEVERYEEEARKGPTHAWKKQVAEFYRDREPAEGVTWVDFTKEDLKGLAHRATEARKGMDKERFGATPSPKGCRFCDYETVCPQRKAQKAENRSKRRSKQSDSLLDNAGGVIKFGFGSEGSVSRD
jgi:hypothetical protein